MENKDEMRLKTVQRFDSCVVSIIDSASRTALYKYEQTNELWTKTEVEGTLMIYSRKAPPHNMIIIINRLNKTDFMEGLTSSCDIQVNPPFLLFRNWKGVIYGIWFSTTECVHRISAAIRQKIDEDSQPALQPAPDIANPSMNITSGGLNGGGDIMSMLSRAHGVYESKRQESNPSVTTTTTPSSTSELVKPSPLRVGESNNTNVADFFAKVGMSGIAASGAALHSPTISSPGTQNATTNPVLQKLFQGAAAVGGQATVGIPVTGGSAPIPISGAPLQTHTTPLSSSVPSSAPISLQELEGKLKENLHVTPNKDDDPSSALKQAHPNASSLLSPQVFTSTNYPERDLITFGDASPNSNNYSSVIAPGPSLGMENKPLNGSSESLQDGQLPQGLSNITPLTHEQLVQAFSFLLKKNDFVQQLHEAYIQALNQSLKGCL